MTIMQSPWVEFLRAVHGWSGRQYRRQVIRRELRRIDRMVVAERRARWEQGLTWEPGSAGQKAQETGGTNG